MSQDDQVKHKIKKEKRLKKKKKKKKQVVELIDPLSPHFVVVRSCRSSRCMQSTEHYHLIQSDINN